MGISKRYTDRVQHYNRAGKSNFSHYIADVRYGESCYCLPMNWTPRKPEFDRASALRLTNSIRPPDESARVYVYCDRRPMVDDAGRVAVLMWPEVDDKLRSRAIFLGMTAQGSRFVIAATRAEWDESATRLPLDWHSMSFRELAPALSAQEGELLAFAQGLVNWHAENHFCPNCGSALAFSEGGHVLRCTGAECGRQIFPRLDPVVIMLVLHQERLLLVRHNRSRASEFYSSIAGFVEYGETLEQAVMRETAEETGLDVCGLSYFGSQAWPFPNSMMVGFWAQASHDVLTLQQTEILEARWFTRAELESPQVPIAPNFSIAGMMIDAWVHGATPVAERMVQPPR